jgi:ATPase subunit of ABC transporter with duplicated ATPase domains
VRVHSGSRIGLIGANGSGKSTLLRVLAGVEPSDGGHVVRRGSIGWLPQLAGTGGEATARETILERIGVAPASRELDRLAARLAARALDAVEPHAAALERWLALGGADAEARLGAAAGEVGLAPALLDRPMSTLSGGQAARAGLAALRTARHDLVLLDEPTNHLDADGLDRLAALPAERAGGVVLVSHDRALLAETVNEVWELDPHTGRATVYSGGWEAYERERDGARQRAIAEYERAVAVRAQLRAAEQEARRRAAESARQVRRRPNDGDKFAREWVTARADGVARRARVVAGRAERHELPERPWTPRPLGLELGAGERRGGHVVALEDAVVRRGTWRLGPLDLAPATTLATFGLEADVAVRPAATLSPGERPARSLPCSPSGAPPACCWTSPRTTWTWSRWRCSKRRCRTGREHWSLRRATAGCATRCGWTGSWSSSIRVDPLPVPARRCLGGRNVNERRSHSRGRRDRVAGSA